MIAEIIDLTQIFMNLASKKAELDERYFEQFVQPAWEAFEKVHQDYKSSFKKYTELLSEENAQLAPIIDQVRQDSIYTSDLRSEVRKLVKHLPSAKLKTKEMYLSNFAKSIDSYFGTSEDHLPLLYRTPQRSDEGQIVAEIDVTEIEKRRDRILDTPASLSKEQIADETVSSSYTNLNINSGDIITESEVSGLIIVDLGLRFINEMRVAAIDVLSSQKNNNNTTELVYTFNTIVNTLQQRYEAVADTYYFLRMELLT